MSWGIGLKSRDNSLTNDEIILQQALVDLGHPAMAASVARGRRFHRLHFTMFGVTPEYEGLAGLRLAFDPDASIPDSKEAWIAEAKVRFASDPGFQTVLAEWENTVLERSKQVESEPSPLESETAGGTSSGSDRQNEKAAQLDDNAAADSAGAGCAGQKKPLRKRLRSLLRKVGLLGPEVPEDLVHTVSER